MEWFPLDLGDLAYRPRYNVAPTQEILTYGAVTGAARETERGHAEYMRWGLIPFFQKQGTKPPYNTFNARDDRMTSGMWRNSFRRRRCLVLADGFYEWKRDGKKRTPYRITLASGEPFGFAGLWDEWHDQERDVTVRSCAIVTTSPNDLMASIHDRMPVILPREAHDMWLDNAISDTDALQQMLKPYPADLMQAYEVSSIVNVVKNDSPECIVPVPGSAPRLLPDE